MQKQSFFEKFWQRKKSRKSQHESVYLDVKKLKWKKIKLDCFFIHFIDFIYPLYFFGIQFIEPLRHNFNFNYDGIKKSKPLKFIDSTHGCRGGPR